MYGQAASGVGDGAGTVDRVVGGAGGVYTGSVAGGTDESSVSTGGGVYAGSVVDGAGDGSACGGGVYTGSVDGAGAPGQAVQVIPELLSVTSDPEQCATAFEPLHRYAQEVM